METHKVSLKEKIGYGFGDAASSMFWKLFTMYLMFFYTVLSGALHQRATGHSPHFGRSARQI